MIEYFFTPVLYPRKIDVKFCDCGPNLFLQSGRRNAVFILKFIVHNHLRSINKPLSVYRTAERVTGTNRMPQASISNHVRVVILFANSIQPLAVSSQKQVIDN